MNADELIVGIRLVRHKLADNASGLTLAKRRVAHFKARSKNAHNPKHPHPLLLERAERRYHFWLNKERLAYRRRHYLREVIRDRVKRLRKLGPRMAHGKAVGGSAAERLHVFFEYARRHWHDYYSESGSYDEAHADTNAAYGGKRRDCSWWFYEARRACGLGGPTAEPRFTSSILEQGRVVDRRYAETHIGVAVVYGSGAGFHVGMSVGFGPYTVEHGTPTLNSGTFDEFGVGTEVRYRAML